MSRWIFCVFFPVTLAEYDYAIHESDIVTSWAHMASDPQHVDLDVAFHTCETMVSCAGVSFRSLDYDMHLPPAGQDVQELYYHNFLPHESAKSHESGWHYYRSGNNFTLLSGRILSQNKIAKPGKHSWTLDRATTFCAKHPDCIGFSFPVPTSASKKNQLESLTQLSFHTQVLGFRHVEDDSWRSYLVNDPTKTLRIDPTKIDYDDQAAMLPYGHCCNRPRQSFSFPTPKEIAAVDTLERVDCATISMDEFHTRYEQPRIPVILVGCDRDWPAKTTWTFDQILSRFPPTSVWRSEIPKENGMSKHSWQEFRQAFRNSSSGTQAYVFDQLDHPLGQELAEDYTTPPQFQNDIYLKFKTPFPNTEFGSRRWFCLGKKYTGTIPHMDPVATDAWNTILRGQKWWVLYPPEVEHVTQVECDLDCSFEEPRASDWYAAVGIHAGRSLFPQGSTAQHVLQRAGETLYVPQGMIHSVLNVEDSIAITENYGSVVGNLIGVWRSVLGEGQDQPQLWKTLYYTLLSADERQKVRESMYWPPDVAMVQIQEEQAAEEAMNGGELYGEDHEDDIIHCEDHDYDCIDRHYPDEDDDGYEENTQEEQEEHEPALPAFNSHEEL